jgi:hypothetical protein
MFGYTSFILKAEACRMEGLRLKQLALLRSNIAMYESKGKVKGHPRTGHEVPEGEKRYSSNLSLIPALDGVGGPCHFTPRKDPAPIV